MGGCKWPQCFANFYHRKLAGSKKSRKISDSNIGRFTVLLSQKCATNLSTKLTDEIMTFNDLMLSCITSRMRKSAAFLTLLRNLEPSKLEGCWFAHSRRDAAEHQVFECHDLISQFCANCCTFLTQQYSAYNR